MKMKNGKYSGQELGYSFIKYAWYKDDLLHREDGPAREWKTGNTYWYINGKLHRLDGPAVECANGTKRWYYHNERVNCKSQEEFELFLRKEKLKAFL